MYLMLSILRGALQGIGDYRAVGISLVGEQAVRLVAGAVLAAVGLGVTGAYLGTPLSFVAMAVYCASHCAAPPAALGRGRAGTPPGRVRPVDARPGGVGADRRARVIAVLQNIDIIAAKHHFSHQTWRAPTPPRRSPPRC